MTCLRQIQSLSECGLDIELKLFGKLKVLRSKPNAPLVFLIDENHSSANCIRQNILDAHELIEKCDVRLIGVESGHGGFKGDPYSEEPEYTSQFDDGTGLTPANNCTTFADHMRELKSVIVVGVESEDLSNRLEAWKSDNPASDTDDCSYNRMRSIHFVKTLFQMNNVHQVNGNMILNVGGNHNSHVAKFIESDVLDSIVGSHASYVRLRSPAYIEGLNPNQM